MISGKIIPISFVVDKGDTLTENYSLSVDLKPGETVTYKTKTKFDLSKAGKHTINVWLNFPNDSNVANDIIKATVYSGLGYTPPNDLALVGINKPLTSCSPMTDEEKIEIEITEPKKIELIEKGEKVNEKPIEDYVMLLRTIPTCSGPMGFYRVMNTTYWINAMKELATMYGERQVKTQIEIVDAYFDSLKETFKGFL